MVRPTKNGSGLSQRDIVMELRTEMREVRSDLTYLRGQMDVLISQKHDSRIEDLEKWRFRADGRMDIIAKGVPFMAAVVGLISALAVLFGSTLLSSPGV